MTVILGYLEIMQLSETISAEMLKKVEDKAQGVMGMIDQIFLPYQKLSQAIWI